MTANFFTPIFTPLLQRTVAGRPICVTARSRRHAAFPALERFPIAWNHVIEKESLNFKELEHVLIEKAEQLFRAMF